MPQLSALAQLPPPAKFQLFSKSAAAFVQLVPVVLAIVYSYLRSTQDYDKQMLSVKMVINFHQRKARIKITAFTRPVENKLSKTGFVTKDVASSPSIT